MSQTVDIGAARINLVVDASDMDATYARAKNAAVEFGTAAEQAFERSTGKSRTAQARLLDYVSTLGAASTEQRRFLELLKKASSEGGQPAVLQAAQRGYNEFVANMEVARAKTESWEQMQKRATIAARGLTEEIARSGDAASKAANERARAYVEGRATQQASNSQSQFNDQLGVVERSAAEQARRRADAEAAILPLLQQQDRELEHQLSLAQQINRARDEQIVANRQSQINAQLGVQDQPRSGAYLADQRRVVEALQAQVAAEDAVEAQAREIHREWVAIEKQIIASTTNMSSYDIARQNAVQRFGPEAAAPLIKQIDQFEKLNKTISGSTVNAKQLQQAIRFLPAQFTDIGVSLAGGMNPLLVAFQQGGQILDQFRLAGASTGDTFRMIGSYAAKLVTPVTAGVAALAAFAYAGYDAAKSMEELAIAAAKGLGQAGSADQLYSFTESLNKMENINLGPAEEAVARLAAGGRLAGQNFNLAAEATARWATLSGEAAERVASQFEAIAKDPLQAIESGLVRVTEAQYNHIKSLVAQGNEQQAVNELTRIWYDTINSNSAQVEAHLSGVSSLWKQITDGTGGAVRAMGDWFNGVALGLADTSAAYQKLLKNGASPLNPMTAAKALWNPYAALTPDEVVFGKNKGKPAPMLYDPAAAARDKARIKEVQDYRDTADEAAQRKTTTRRLRERGNELQLDKKEIDRVIATQQKKWDEADAKKNKGSKGGMRATSAAKDVRYEFQLESAMLQTQTREVQAAYAIKKISAESYYDSLRKFAQQEFDIQKRSNAEQLAAVVGKKGQEHEVARLRVADAIAEQQLAQRTIDINSQQAQQMRQLEQERRSYNNALRDGVQAQQEDFDAAFQRYTMGDKEFERFNAKNELRKEEARLLRDLDRQVQDGAITAEEAEARKQAAIQATIDKLAQTEGMYERLDAAQGDWAVGASKAWKNWQDDVADVAGQSEAFFGEALSGFADATTDTLTGNLDSWGDYFDGLARMITQFIVQQKLTGWIKSLSAQQAGGGGGGGGIVGFLSGLAGALFGGGVGPTSASAAGGSMPTAGPMFANGGFTGAGDDREIAGYVHKNEYVVPASVVRAIRAGRPSSAPAAAGKSVTIIQNNKFDIASDKTTRDQYRREQANVTQKAMAKA